MFFSQNILEITSLASNQWDNFKDKAVILNQMRNLIEKSNMKKSVTTAVNFIRNFGVFMNKSEIDREIKLKFLHSTLQSVHLMSDKLNLKIRKNPETRLIIHALAAASDNNNIRVVSTKHQS